MVTRLAGRRVLIVEDDYYLATDLARSLRAIGAVPLGPVPDPEEAMPLIPMADAAALDVELRGGTTSAPIADALATLGTPFLFVTGRNDRIPEPHRSRPICPKPTTDRAVLTALVALVVEPERDIGLSVEPRVQRRGGDYHG